MKVKLDHLVPLPPELWPPEIGDILQELGNPLNIHSIMANHAALMMAWMPFRNHIVKNSSLEPRFRELLILRTAANCAADYEWKHHVVRGREAGLSDEEIQRVKDCPGAAEWSSADRLILLAADECHRGSEINEETRCELGRHFNACQQLDIIVTVGMYKTLAVIIKTYKLPFEE